MAVGFIAFLAGKWQQARAERAKGKYYAVLYARRAAPMRGRGMFLGRDDRRLMAPLFRA
jgi:hypothetical protein